LAFAWPYAANFAKKCRTASVVIWDNSLSMTSSSYYRELEKRLHDMLSNIDTENPLTAASVGKNVKWMPGFTSDPEEAAEFFRKNIPGEGISHFEAALRRADILLKEMNSGTKQIVVFTDMQKSPWSGVKFRKSLSPGVKLKVIKPDKPAFENAAVTFFECGSKFTRERMPLVFKLAVRNFSKKSEFEGTVKIYMNGKVLFSRHEKVIPESEKIIKAVLISGELKPCMLKAVFETDDMIKKDNTRYFALNPVKLPRVSVSELASGEFDYLKVAISLESGRKCAETTQFNPSDIRESNLVVLRSAPNREEAEALDKFLSSGGNVFVLCGKENHTVEYLKKYGINISDVKSGKGNTVYLKNIKFRHRIFRKFSKGKIGSFYEIAFFEPQHVVVPENGKVIAEFSNGSPALFELPVDKGRLLVLCCGFDRASTNWSVHSTFLPFIRETVDFLSSQKNETSAYTVGDSLDTAGFSSYLFCKDDNKTEKLLDGAGRLYAEKSGVYLFRRKNKISKAVSVNVPLSESKNELLSESFDPSVLEFKGGNSGTSNNLTEDAGFISYDNGKPYWRLVLCAALLFFMCEFILSNRTVL
jgi:hypothetical protein